MRDKLSEKNTLNLTMIIIQLGNNLSIINDVIQLKIELNNSFYKMAESDFQKFLDENKIDPAAIMRDSATSGAAKTAKDTMQRMNAALDKRMNAYPYSAEDIYQSKIAYLTSLIKHTMK